MDEQEGTLMDGVREYSEGYEVRLVETTGLYFGIGKDRPGVGRLAIVALNEGGHNFTEVDLLDVLAWVKANKPDLLQ